MSRPSPAQRRALLLFPVGVGQRSEQWLEDRCGRRVLNSLLERGWIEQDAGFAPHGKAWLGLTIAGLDAQRQARVALSR